MRSKLFTRFATAPSVCGWFVPAPWLSTSNHSVGSPRLQTYTFTLKVRFHKLTACRGKVLPQILVFHFSGLFLRLAFSVGFLARSTALFLSQETVFLLDDPLTAI